MRRESLDAGVTWLHGQIERDGEGIEGLDQTLAEKSVAMSKELGWPAEGFEKRGMSEPGAVFGPAWSTMVLEPSVLGFVPAPGVGVDAKAIAFGQQFVEELAVVVEGQSARP